MDTSSTLPASQGAASDAASPLTAAARQLAHLNRQYIGLLALDGALPDALAPRIRGLSGAAVSAMADCPFSLFTLGFEDSRRWLRLLAGASREPTPHSADSRTAAHGEFVATVVFLAWHLAHSDALAAKVLLQLDAAVVDALRAIPIADLRAVGSEAVTWLQPRWPQNHFFWPALLRHSSDPTGAGMRATKLLGRQLLAAESIALAPTLQKGVTRRLSVVRSNRSL